MSDISVIGGDDSPIVDKRELAGYLTEQAALLIGPTGPAGPTGGKGDKGDTGPGLLMVPPPTGINDSTAIQDTLNAAAGRAVKFGPGNYVVTQQITFGSDTTIIFDPGTTIYHTIAGAAFKATGTQSATQTLLTATSSAGQYTITAPGHGLAEGDTFRLSSNKLFDASSTSIKIGEQCRVLSVAGDVITVVSPLQGTSYTVADGAYIKKITPVTNILITGGGTIKGLKTPTMGQYGVDIAMARNVRIDGVHFRDIDRRHVYFSDVINGAIEHCTFNWAIDNTMAYGVSIANCTQDTAVRFNTFTNVRHAFTTNNEAAYPGIPRRITFAHNTVWWTSTALGGSAGGGDAIDTHTAAEDVFIEYNRVHGSAGQGINFECRSGRIIGNHIIGTTSYGISVHNESDLPGRILITHNEVRRSGNTAIYVRTGIRGTTAVYEYINVSHNVILDSVGYGITVGYDAATTGPETGVTVTGNTSIRTGGVYAFYITHVSGATITANRTNGGSALTLVNDSLVATGDHPGYLYRVIASDAVQITPDARYVALDTEASAATDNLATITGGLKGQVITLKTFANARDVVVTSAGNIRTVSAFTLDAARDSITLGYDGANWVEQNRADFPAA